MRAISRRRFALATLVLTCTMLTGCVPEPALFLRSSAEGFTVRVCGPGTIEALRVDTLASGAPVSDGWDERWALSGKAGVLDYMDIQYGVVPNGLEAAGNPQQVDLSTQDLRVEVLLVPESGVQTRQITAIFEGRTATDLAWTAQGGREVPNPCSDQ